MFKFALNRNDSWYFTKAVYPWKVEKFPLYLFIYLTHGHLHYLRHLHLHCEL